MTTEEEKAAQWEFKERWALARNPRERRTLWRQALSSGLWPQGRGALRAHPIGQSQGGSFTYCALGVACEVSSGVWLVSANGRSICRKGNSIGIQTLPKRLAEILEVDENPRLLHEGRMRFLSELNDEEELSFKEIAHLLRTQIP